MPNDDKKSEMPDVKKSEITDDKSQSFAQLGERMKNLESKEKVLPYQALLLRADGNGFSRYTAGFPKPFDPRFQRAIVRTGNELLLQLNSTIVFMCSDEISIVFPPVCTKEEYDTLILSGATNIPSHLYSGRREKFVSLVASKCSVIFNRFMWEEAKNAPCYSDTVRERIESSSAIFDARLIVIPHGAEVEIVNNLIWRSTLDCYRNTTSAYARHILGQKACLNKNSTEMIEMMMKRGFDYVNDVPISYKYGVLGKKILVTMSNEKGTFVRSRVHNFSANLIQQNISTTLDLFFCKYFTNGLIESVEFNCTQGADETRAQMSPGADESKARMSPRRR